MPEGFKEASLRIGDEDARYFLQAWEAGLIVRKSPGAYTAPASHVTEQLFWDGRKTYSPRPYTLWLEPIITFGGLSRLHHDHGWPVAQIGTQSIDWAFDLVARLPGEAEEFIAGEVKKSRREIDAMLDVMNALGADPAHSEPPSGDKTRNAYKKLAGLKARRAAVFWALGPEGYSLVFRVNYFDDGRVEFEPVGQDALEYQV
ncbi:hypothetical protein AWH62_13525 [Maricaulis sp. W15]|nr:hypothetical protein AWH62_13525 [Maricaulis sp. W15]